MPLWIKTNLVSTTLRLTSWSRQSRVDAPDVSDLELLQLADLDMVLGKFIRQDVLSDSSSTV